MADSMRSRGLARWALAAFVVGVTLALAACDAKRISELEPGVTTEAQVRDRWGEPAAIYAEEDGGHTLEYPRQPAGQVNYMLAIGADGKLAALHQVLKPANFLRIQKGWDRAQVRRLLGLPAKTQRYALKQEEVWDWRFADGGEARLFSVTFDAEGRVTRTATLDDPKENGQRG
jgi:hypothetical protein